MKKIIAFFTGVLVFIGCDQIVSPPENKEVVLKNTITTLSIVRSGVNTVRIQLESAEPIYGLQFSVSSSSHIILEKLIPSFLTCGKYWDVDFYNVNDSLMNVLIFNLHKEYIPIGSGFVAEISFQSLSDTSLFSIYLTRVMLTNENADSIGVSIHNLEGKIL